MVENQTRDSSAVGVRPLRADVLTAAEAVVDRHGWDGLTVSAVARELGMAQPSMYKHVHGLDQLRCQLHLAAIAALSEHLRDATVGRSGEDAIRAMAAAYRSFARRYPARYAALTQVAHGDTTRDARDQAKGALTNVYRAVLRSFGLDAEAERTTEAALWAALHGIVSLELTGAIPEALAAQTYERLLQMLINDLSKRHPAAREH